MWPVRRSALMVITRTIRMVARPTATMDRVGSRTGSLSALAPGTAGDIHITDAPTVAALTADLRDVVLIDVDVVLIDVDVALMEMVRRFGAASQGAVRAEGPAVGSMEDPAAAANKLHRV